MLHPDILDSRPHAALGAFLRARRQTLGWTQARLAEECGISRPFLANLEVGTNELSLARAARLARALGVSVDALAQAAEA